MKFAQQHGAVVQGVDPSESGIRHAKEAGLDAHLASAYDDLNQRFGTFDAVVSLEVVEHVYAPRKYAASLYSLVKPGGVAMISTPFHGYFKNLIIALTGNTDSHFNPLWDHGHIKFWSPNTLRELLSEAGFCEAKYKFVGRRYPLSKSMIAVVKKPNDTSRSTGGDRNE